MIGTAPSSRAMSPQSNQSWRVWRPGETPRIDEAESFEEGPDYLLAEGAGGEISAGANFDIPILFRGFSENSGPSFTNTVEHCLTR